MQLRRVRSLLPTPPQLHQGVRSRPQPRAYTRDTPLCFVHDASTPEPFCCRLVSTMRVLLVACVRYAEVNKGVEQAFLSIAKRLVARKAAAPRGTGGGAGSGRGRGSNLIVVDQKPKPATQQECC